MMYRMTCSGLSAKRTFERSSAPHVRPVTARSEANAVPAKQRRVQPVMGTSSGSRETRIDDELRLPAVPDPLKVLVRDPDPPRPSIDRGPGHVRGDNDVLQAEKRIVRPWRLRIEYVDGGAGDPLIGKPPKKTPLGDDLSSRRF